MYGDGFEFGTCLDAGDLADDGLDDLVVGTLQHFGEWLPGYSTTTTTLSVLFGVDLATGTRTQLGRGWGSSAIDAAEGAGYAAMIADLSGDGYPDVVAGAGQKSGATASTTVELWAGTGP